jgi:hypothetical protein
MNMNFFYTIDKALEARGTAHTKIWAKDSESKTNKGAKKFSLCETAAFLNHYEKCTPQDRTFYECIDENVPCFIYVDTEYTVSFNQSRVSEEMERKFKELFRCFMATEYPTLGELEFITLDASNAGKFSKHFTITAAHGSVMMKNNYHVGALMRKFHRWFALGQGPAEVLSCINGEGGVYDAETCLFNVKNEKGQTVLFIDLAVYTKRRMFRICGSVKKGGDRPLRLQGLDGQSLPWAREHLVTSLVQPEICGSMLLECLEYDGQEPKSTSNIKIHIETVKPKTHHPFVPRSVEYTICTDGSLLETIRKLIETEEKVHVRDNAIKISHGVVHVPSTSRVCGIANREHASNHIYFNVYLSLLSYVQKCFDSDCVNRKAWTKPIPMEYHTLFNSRRSESKDTRDMKDFFVSAGLTLESP